MVDKVMAELNPDSKKFIASLENLHEMTDFVVDYTKKMGFSDEQIGKVQLFAEEALVNIVQYAYPECEEGEETGEIFLACSASADCLKVEMRDKGREFDPVSEAKEIDTSLSIEERDIGGLGLYIMKKILTKMDYKREGDTNILTLSLVKDKAVDEQTSA